MDSAKQSVNEARQSRIGFNTLDCAGSREFKAAEIHRDTPRFQRGFTLELPVKRDQPLMSTLRGATDVATRTMQPSSEKRGREGEEAEELNGEANVAAFHGVNRF